MNRHERYMWSENRSETLPALMARLVEAYECNPERSAAIMRFRHLPGSSLVSQNPVNSAVADALSQSNSQAAQETFHRTLHDGSSQRQRYSELIETWHRGNEHLLEDELNDDLASGDSAWMRTAPEKERFDDTPDKIERMMESPNLAMYLREQNENQVQRYQKEAEMLETIPAMKEEWAERFGVDSALPADEFVRLCHLAQVRQMEEADLGFLRAPSSTVFWAKELVGRLAEVVEREDAIAKHPIARLSPEVPNGIRVLFEQAHLAYLFDFDIPCTLTCGALVEEAFQVRFAEMFSTWDEDYLEARKRGEKPHALAFREKIDRVVERYPFVEPAKRHAIEVWDARTRAMHKPEEYIRRDRNNSEAILSYARAVLKTLFEPVPD